MTASRFVSDEIVHLNVGGLRFTTSRQTLTWVPDSFFTSMLSDRIATSRDETGAIFIDRDPKLFGIILNYLRSRDVDLKDVDIAILRHEAEYYAISPLVKKLMLCEDLHYSSCGDVLFHGYLPPPNLPSHIPSSNAELENISEPQDCETTSSDPTDQPVSSSSQTVKSSCRIQSNVKVSDVTSCSDSLSAIDISAKTPSGGTSSLQCYGGAISKDSSTVVPPLKSSHSLSHKCETNRTRSLPNVSVNSLTVKCVKAHHNWIAVAYAHFVTCYRMKDSCGWQLAFTSPFVKNIIERVALNAKVMTSSQSEKSNKMLAIAYDFQIRLWSITGDGGHTEIGIFNLNVPVDHLFFIGSQLVALSHTGKVGAWHSMTQHWQTQDVYPIASFDTAGSFLLLGCNNGSIYYIDMQKFPLRMKDNDLLVTELYRNPSNEVITAISVYLTPKTSLCGNWIEIAYGTSSGMVRVIVQHPETVGHGPQLFQTFTVHRSPVTRVMLSEKYLVSVCSEYNHVRTWSVTRFRGMISTQPGSTPLASFKIVSLEDIETKSSYSMANDCGPYGEQDDEQVFIQKVVPETDKLYIRLSSTGKRVCTIKSVDGSTISSFCVHECDGSNRMGSRPRRYMFTGHTSGAIQMWDLTTAMDLAVKGEPTSNECGGPTPSELVKLLDQCDLSHSDTPNINPPPSLAINSNRQRLSGSTFLTNTQFCARSARDGQISSCDTKADASSDSKSTN